MCVIILRTFENDLKIMDVLAFVAHRNELPVLFTALVPWKLQVNLVRVQNSLSQCNRRNREEQRIFFLHGLWG